MSDLDDRDLDDLDLDSDRPQVAAVWAIGDPGWLFAECVNVDGATSFWLLGPGRSDDDAPRGIPEHERLGRLPAEYRERLGLRPRCGRPKSSGEPCRMLVREPGAACEWHRAKDGAR